LKIFKDIKVVLNSSGITVPKIVLKLFSYSTFCKFFKGIPSVLSFLFNKNLSNTNFLLRLYLIVKFYLISLYIPCPHKQSEILQIVESILSIPPDVEGCVVEAGSYKGGSAIKLSLACKIINRPLVVFDSFEGTPENDETEGGMHFGKGAYQATLEEVKKNIREFGNIDVCRFYKGWFENTMPKFNKKICLIFMDVDLASSTKTCLKYFYPLLINRGVIFSHDGHIEYVVKMLESDKFWEDEVNYKKPYIEGLRERKLLRIIKDKSEF